VAEVVMTKQKIASLLRAIARRDDKSVYKDELFITAEENDALEQAAQLIEASPDEPRAPHYGGFSQPSLTLTCECGGQTFSGSIGAENPTPLTCDACGRPMKPYFSYT
jgi:hypothetical protein